MKELVKAVAVLATITAPSMAAAQDEVEATLGADIVSNYIWRGSDLGGAAIQPTIGVSYKGFSLTGWGSYGIADRNDTKEFDLTLSYSTGGFTLGITDYYCLSGTENCPTKYFLYDAHKTSHEFEANVGYDFGVLSFNWYTIFAGNDGMNKDGDRAYSSYFEIGAPFKLGGLDWEATVGAVPYSTDYYEDATNGFVINNVTLKASKEVALSSKLTVPVFGAISANPSTQKLYFTAGISF